MSEMDPGQADKELEQEWMDSRTPSWEWAVAAVSTLLVSAFIGYVLYLALTASSDPPDISVHSRGMHSSATHLVLIEVLNMGGQAAAQLTIVGELADSQGQVVEANEITFDYLPPQSSRKGGLIFTRDPNLHSLHIRPTGWIEP